MGMNAVMDTLNAAYKVKENRSLFKQYAVATGLTLGIAFLLVISVVIVLAGDKIARALSPGNILAITWKVAQWPTGARADLIGFCDYELLCCQSSQSAVTLGDAGRNCRRDPLAGGVLWAADLSAVRFHLQRWVRFSGRSYCSASLVLLEWNRGAFRSRDQWRSRKSRCFSRRRATKKHISIESRLTAKAQDALSAKMGIRVMTKDSDRRELLPCVTSSAT